MHAKMSTLQKIKQLDWMIEAGTKSVITLQTLIKYTILY